MGNSRKVVLFIVEGPSDETALGLLLTRLFAPLQVNFDVMHGDVTTERCFNASLSKKNVRDILRQRIVDHVCRQPYRWDDLERIVMLTDTDGAYTDNTAMRQRNSVKTEDTRKLSGCDCLTYNKKSVPFRIFYFSTNLEHVLHNRGDDVSDAEKKALAREFSERFKNDLDGFVTFMRDSAFAVSGDYRETWAYIFQGDNSTERHSNVHLMLDVDVADQDSQ